MIIITYSGSNDGCTFSPPYLAPFNMRDGTKRPKETAMTKFIGPSEKVGG
jgi:hypothetical protein